MLQEFLHALALVAKIFARPRDYICHSCGELILEDKEGQTHCSCLEDNSRVSK